MVLLYVRSKILGLFKEKSERMQTFLASPSQGEKMSKAALLTEMRSHRQQSQAAKTKEPLHGIETGSPMVVTLGHCCRRH